MNHVLWFDELDRGYLEIAKNGSNSIQEALVAEGLYGRNMGRDDAYGRDIVVMWRDPYDRAASAYRMSRKNKARMAHLPFNQWIVTWTKHAPHFDEIIATQWDHCVTTSGDFVPNRVVAWDFDEFSRLFGLKWMPHLNQTRSHGRRRLPTSKEAIAAFEDYYARDIEVWRGLTLEAV